MSYLDHKCGNLTKTLATNYQARSKSRAQAALTPYAAALKVHFSANGKLSDVTANVQRRSSSNIGLKPIAAPC